MKIDLHNHTSVSPDSLMSPRTLIDYALKRDIGVLAITDHDSIKNVKICQEYAGKKILIVPGFEIKTTIGDVLGLFIEKLPPSKEIYKVIDFIEKENGLSVLPHPFNDSSRNSRKQDEFIKHIDLIEGFNGRTTFEKNVKALKLAKKFNKPITAGSDAHVKINVGSTYQISDSVENLDDLREQLLTGINIVNFQFTNWYWLNYSQFIKNVKRRQFIKKNIGLVHNSFIHLKQGFIRSIK